MVWYFEHSIYVYNERVGKLNTVYETRNAVAGPISITNGIEHTVSKQ